MILGICLLASLILVCGQASNATTTTPATMPAATTTTAAPPTTTTTVMTTVAATTPVATTTTGATTTGATPPPTTNVTTTVGTTFGGTNTTITNNTTTAMGTATAPMCGNASDCIGCIAVDGCVWCGEQCILTGDICSVGTAVKFLCPTTTAAPSNGTTSASAAPATTQGNATSTVGAPNGIFDDPFSEEHLPITAGAAGGLLLLIIIIVVAVVCVCKKRGNSDDDDILYGTALHSAGTDVLPAPVPVSSSEATSTHAVDQATVARAAMPAPIAAGDEGATPQFDADGNPLSAPPVPDIAPPISTENYGKLPNAPLTASPDAAPENYAQISNVALPGVGAPPPPGFGGQMNAGAAPPPPRPDLPPPP